MQYDVVKNYACIEIDFHIDGSEEYTSCWLGKTIDSETNQATYWSGLTPDGSQAYSFDTLEKFVTAEVFKNDSLEKIWHLVSINSIDGCSIEYRLSFYLDLKDGPIRRPARPPARLDSSKD